MTLLLSLFLSFYSRFLTIILRRGFFFLVFWCFHGLFPQFPFTSFIICIVHCHISYKVSVCHCLLSWSSHREPRTAKYTTLGWTIIFQLNFSKIMWWPSIRAHIPIVWIIPTSELPSRFLLAPQTTVVYACMSSRRPLSKVFEIEPRVCSWRLVQHHPIEPIDWMNHPDTW